MFAVQVYPLFLLKEDPRISMNRGGSMIIAPELNIQGAQVSD
jgi:hypothetical protein